MGASSKRHGQPNILGMSKSQCDGKFDKVRCIVCSKINKIDKIIHAKDDNSKKKKKKKPRLGESPHGLANLESEELIVVLGYGLHPQER